MPKAGGGFRLKNGDDLGLKLRLAAAAIIVTSSLCGYWLNSMERSNMYREKTADEAEIMMQSSEEDEQTLININTAGIEELTKLPGIGEKKAQRIIEYREENEKFYDLSEIKNIQGIGDTIYEDIKDMITTG